MSDFSEKLKAGHASGSWKAPEKEPPGAIKGALTNFFGGIEQVAGTAIKGLGAQLNALDEIGRKGSFSEAVRNSGGTYLRDAGESLIGTGNAINQRAEDITRDTRTLDKYQSMGLWDRLTSPEYLTDSRGLWSDAWSGLGNSVPFLLPGATVPKVARAIDGALVGRAAMEAAARAAAERELAKSGLRKSAESIAQYGVTGGPLDAFTNASEMYDELKAQGLSDADIAQRIRAAAAEELPYDIAETGITGSVLRGKLFNPGAGASRGERFAKGLLGVPVDATGEYFQESMQTRMNNKYTGKPYGTVFNPTPEEAAAGATGFFGGLIPGFGGAVHSAIPAPIIEQTPAVDAYGASDMPAQETPTPAATNGMQPAASEADIQRILSQLLADPYNQQEQFASESETAPAGSVDVSNIPMQDIEDAGLANTNNALKGKLRQLFDWTKDTFGKEFEVSGGARSPEHNRQVNGSETSHHLHGNAVDINVSMLTDEEREAFFQKAAELGFNDHGQGDDWYHDKGSGLHAHLTYMDDGRQQGGQREGSSNAWAIHDVFRDAGYSDEAIAGILGRVQQEHNFDTSNVEEYDDAETGEHLGGYGMFQWNGSRTTDFLNWAKQNKLDPQDATVQARYALQEAQQRGLTPEKMNNLSAEEAADLWTSDWEVGKPGSERQYANEWLQRIQNGGGAVATGASTKGTKGSKSKPTDTSDPEMDRMYEEFAKTWQREADEGEKDIFEGMFTKNGKFIDSEENRRIIDEQYGDEFRQFQEEEKNPSIQKQMDRLIDEAVQTKDFDRLQALQTAKQSGDISAMRSFLDEAKAKQGQIRELPTQTGGNINGNENTKGTQTQPTQGENAGNQNQNPESGQGQAAEGQNSVNRKTTYSDFLAGLGIDPARLDAERQNIRDMHYKQLAADEASSGMVPHLDRAINSDPAKAAGNMAMAGFQGAKGWERGQLGAALEQALQNPATAQQAMAAIRQMQAEDEAAYFNTDVHVQEGVGKNRKPVHIRSKESGLTPGAQQKYNQKDWHNFAGREGYKGSNVPAQHTKAQQQSTQESAGLKKFREVAKDFIEQYKADKITYSKALQGINKARSLAKRAVRISVEQDIEDAYKVAVNELSRIRAEKENQPTREAASQDESLEETSRTTSEPVQQKESKALSQLKKNAEKIVKDYRADESTYDEAWRKVVSIQESAERVAPDNDTREAIQDVARGALMELENIYNEKNGHELGKTPSQTAQEGAGEQEATAQVEEPAQEEKPAQSEAEPASNEGGEKSAQNEDDYHGFLDDKAPGAVKEIKRQLEKKDASFGTGLLTTKHIVERWAETDETNQSQAKGEKFYLHGNKVSKALYDYYNHLLGENGNPKQTEGKTDTKLQRLRSGKEEMQAVAKKYADGEISQTEAYRQVAAIAKEKATRAKDGLPNVTFIDNKIKQELNDYGDRLIDEAGDAAEAKEASESKFREISAILSKYEKGEKNLVPIEDLMKQVHNSKTLSQEHMKALDERAAKIAEKSAKPAETQQEAFNTDSLFDEFTKKHADRQRTQQEIKDFLSRPMPRRTEKSFLEKHYLGADNRKDYIERAAALYCRAVADNDQETLNANSHRFNHKEPLDRQYFEYLINSEAFKADVLGEKAEPKQEKPAETENNTVKEPAKEEGNNEQQGESGSLDGGHGDMEPGGGREDQREGTGEVSGRDGREGETDGRDDGQEHSEESQSAGVRAGTELEAAAGQGTDKRGNQPEVPLTEAEAHPSPTETPGHNYEIKDTDLSTKSEKVRFKQNVEAIKMLKQLEADDRMPTPAEQEILAGYNGWGGLKGAFIEGSDMNKEIRELLTEEEYKAARSTINDAFYTPPKLIRAIWEGISHLGFKGGRVLDPSMGVGNFFGTMPRDMMEKSTLRGVELDDLTSRLGRMLYPGAFVEHKGFQKSAAADNYFDLAISNIPFGQSMIDGYQVHNFFFANGIDKVRPGGLMVYITSQGSLAGGKDAVRMRNYLAGQADLIAAYKLPSGVFSDSGTQVATDIVIFRKRDKDGKKSPYGQKFADVKEIKRGDGYWAQKLYDINEYFEAHPENILGEQSNGKDQWGNPALNVKMAEGASVADVANDLESAMKKLPEDVYQPVSHKKPKAFDAASAQKRAAAAEKTRDYEYYYKDGKPVQNQNGQEVAVTGAKAKIVDSYLKLKNTLNALFAAESDPKATNKQVESIRKKLNKDYDAFVAKHGLLTGKAAAAFRDDPSAGMMQALEKPKEETYKDKKGNERKRIVGAEKADIFSVRSIKPVQEVTHVESADDALIASLTNRGGVDLDYMAGLMNSKPEKLVSQLKGKVFRNPVTEDYETREEYLSGNVREKLAQAKEAAKSDQAYADNAKELEKVVPEDLVSDEIYVNLGTPWIPVSDVQDFVNSITDGLTVKFSRGAALWNVTGWGSSAKYKLKGITLNELFDHVLNNKAIQIYDGSGDDKVFNKEKTDAANVAAEELQQDFRDWIWKDKEREKRLTRYYNDNYNNTVVRQYNGQHLNLHNYGMNAKITLKPHQKDVVWRMLQGQNTLIAHCVGAGKTFEMQAAGMEMRRLGIVNKPMYCLPNNVVQQFAREFRILYPNAKLLVLQSNDLPAVEKTSKLVKTEDGRTKRESLLEGKTPEQKAAIMAKRTARNRMLNRIRTEDWDGIIISHNLFQRFPVTPDTAAAFIQQEIDNLEQTIREARADRSMDTRALSNLENAKKNLEERLEDAISTDIEDIGVPFEELGVDQLFVDEADMFKNLEFATRLGNIRGLSNSKANRSRDMFIKTQWLTNTLNGRGVVFATGTPISNTMAEMYTMLRYLDLKGLKEKGLELFDNWLRTFGDIGQGYERKPTGDGFRKVTMVKQFANMAELKKMFRKIADVKVQEELDLDIPKLKNGKSTVVALEPDPKVVNYIKNVVPERVKNMKSGFKKEKGEDNMLSLTNDLRKLSLTDSKIEACADAIAKKYHETTDVKGTQLVFCDMGIPRAEKGEAASFSDANGEVVASIENPEVYRKLIGMLKEKGIPEKDIAFIQNYNTKQKRDSVFQKVNDGEVRILIGSTETMGAGTNCQKHLVALHDLDAPWRPRDLEQRHGRILRQGNENKEVEIFNYVVKGSFDANMWEKLKNKAAIIQQAMSNDMNLRVVEDADLVTLSYAEIEGEADNNPLTKEQLKVKNDLTKYQHAQTAFRKKVRDAENLLDGADERVEKKKREIAKVEKDIAQRKDTKGDKFSMLVGKTGYKERGKADEALTKLLENLSKRNPVEIGQIGGFRLMGYHDGVEPKLFLVNNLTYEVNKNSVQGIEYVLNHAPETDLANLNAGLERMEKDIAQAEEIVRQENPYAEKVKTLSDRLNQLNREIAETLVDDGKQAAETAPKEESEEEKPSSNRKYSLDNSDNRRYSVNREVDSETLLEATKRAMRALAARYLPEKTGIRYRLRTSIKADVARAKREGKEVNRDELPTIKNRLVLFNETDEANKAMIAAEIYYARRCFENDFGGNVDNAHEGIRRNPGTERGASGVNAEDGNIAREGEGAFADLRDARPLIIDGEKDDAHKFWKDILEKEIDYSVGLLTKPKGHSIRQGAFSNARSIDELKAETREAFPNATKVTEEGNKLTFHMPNGQVVEFTFHEKINASEEELAKAKQEHGIADHVTVTVEGYAEVVDGKGIAALSQASREGTGFHEAYHVAEALAFTKKELADAKRLISANEEERADAYAKWKLERKKYSNFAKLWQKIADVAAKLAGILGYETKRNIFRKVESGEIYERDNTAMNLSRKYSIDSADNSKESYLHRVKNFFSKSRAADTPEYRRMLKGMMEEIAGIKIRYGKIDPQMAAVYDSFKKVIRAKNANDWERVLPLFAGATLEKLGVEPNEKLNAYISDWIQTGAPNNNSSEAAIFQKAMKDNPEIGDQLIDLQEAFQRWDKMNAMERGQSVISYQHKEKTTLSEKATEVYTQFVEEINPVMNLVQEIEKKHGKLNRTSNPYEAFRLFRGYKGRAMTLIEGNTKAISDVMAHWYPNLNWKGFKSIHAILDSVGALHDKKTREEFSAYCLACHVYDIHKANDLTTMEIERLSGELANASEEKQEEIKQKIERLNKTIMDTPLSRTDCGEIIRGHKQKYGKAQQDLVHYSNMTLAILKDSGMISERRYNNILKKWPNYVPMFRVFDDNGNVQFGDSMKALTGSSRDVIDPLESIIRNTFDFVRKAEKNKAKCLLANLAQMSDVGKYIDPVDNPSPDDKTTITYYVDGQKRYLQTDPAVVTAVNGMGLDSSNMYRSLFRLPSAFARSAFTIMDLTFIVRNSARDIQDAFVYNKKGAWNPLTIITDWIEGLLHAIRQDDVYWEWMSSGAAQSSAVSVDRNFTQSTLDKMTKTKAQRLMSPKFLIFDTMQKLAEFSELATRISNYQRIKKNLSNGGMKQLTMEDMLEAAYESRDLMDFARGGKASRVWNSVSVFANPAIQGWDKFYRTFKGLASKDKQERKEAMYAAARLVLGGMLPALVLTLMHWDKDWWKEIPDWQKDNHWIISERFRIPKGQDIGIRFFSSLIEKGLDSMYNKSPMTAMRIMKPIYEQLPDIMPTAMMPILEAAANFSFFKQAPIVPQYQKDLPAKLQYSPFSSGFAKFVSEQLSDKFDVSLSPRQIDHVLTGFGGNVSRGATGAADVVMGNKQLNTSIEEAPVFRGFMMIPYKNSATVDKFYKEYRKQVEGDKAFKATKERMEGYSPAKYKRMTQANKKMSELNKKERKLLDDKRISPARKQELQAGIQRQRIAIAKGALGMK